MVVATVLALCSALLPAALAAEATPNPFNPEYYADAWAGVCATGKMQTPIDLPKDSGGIPGVPENLVSDIKFPVVSAPVTKNPGSSLQVSWDPFSAFDMEDDSLFPIVAAGGDRISDVILKDDVRAEYMLKMIPLQIHWHVASEHSIGGMLAPMEAHIVTAVGPGEAPTDWGCDAVWEGGDPVLEKCIAVFGIVYVTTPDAKSPEYFDHLFSSFPSVAGSEAAFPAPTFDLNSLLPEDKSYYGYVGSLTTPPCSEGLRWHVFTEYVPISIETVTAFEELLVNVTDLDTGERQLFRHNNRPVHHLNGRVIYHHSESGRARKERG